MRDARAAGAGPWTPLAAAGAAAGLALFLRFPDLDIRILGLGSHRYFAFHSALVPLLLFAAARGRGRPRLLAALAAGVAAGAAAAFTLHLFLDSFQSHPVKFPIVGSLVDGTSLDDRLWLLGNALASLALGVRVLWLHLRRKGGPPPTSL